MYAHFSSLFKPVPQSEINSQPSIALVSVGHDGALRHLVQTPAWVSYARAFGQRQRAEHIDGVQGGRKGVESRNSLYEKNALESCRTQTSLPSKC